MNLTKLRLKQMEKVIKSEALESMDKAIGGRKFKGKPALISEKQKSGLDKHTLN